VWLYHECKNQTSKSRMSTTQVVKENPRISPGASFYL